MIYADIEYSKELAWLFPDAEWWWSVGNQRTELLKKDNATINEYWYKHEIYPAITTDMALEVLPSGISIFKKDTGYLVFCDLVCCEGPNGEPFIAMGTSLVSALMRMAKYLVDN